MRRSSTRPPICGDSVASGPQSDGVHSSGGSAPAARRTGSRPGIRCLCHRFIAVVTIRTLRRCRHPAPRQSAAPEPWRPWSTFNLRTSARGGRTSDRLGHRSKAPGEALDGHPGTGRALRALNSPLVVTVVANAEAVSHGPWLGSEAPAGQALDPVVEGYQGFDPGNLGNGEVDGGRPGGEDHSAFALTIEVGYRQQANFT
jgi:hypothetical protein